MKIPEEEEMTPYERGKLCAEKGYHPDFYNIYKDNVFSTFHEDYMMGYRDNCGDSTNENT